MLYRFTLVLPVLFALLLFTGGLGVAQENDEEDLVIFSVIHTQTVGEDVAPAALPNEIRVKLGQRVRIFNITPDPAEVVHDPVVLSEDPDGTIPLFDGAQFLLEPGTIPSVNFEADELSTFYLTHRPHGHDIVLTIIVEE